MKEKESMDFSKVKQMWRISESGGGRRENNQIVKYLEKINEHLRLCPNHHYGVLPSPSLSLFPVSNHAS